MTSTFIVCPRGIAIVGNQHSEIASYFSVISGVKNSIQLPFYCKQLLTGRKKLTNQNTKKKKEQIDVLSWHNLLIMLMLKQPEKKSNQELPWP